MMGDVLGEIWDEARREESLLHEGGRDRRKSRKQGEKAEQYQEH